jgi:hypothetical protein
VNEYLKQIKYSDEEILKIPSIHDPFTWAKLPFYLDFDLETDYRELFNK